MSFKKEITRYCIQLHISEVTHWVLPKNLRVVVNTLRVREQETTVLAWFALRPHAFMGRWTLRGKTALVS